MASRGYEDGSVGLGAVFLASVFGPMAILAALWALAAGAGATGPTRDFAGQAMVWVLLVAGLIITVEEAILIGMSAFKRRSVVWPAPAPAPVETEPHEGAEPASPSA